MQPNTIHTGDCLNVMASWPDGCVDLVYLDPPYNTGKDWGAFDDRWASMDAYIEYLRVRLVALKRVMKDTASIYLHCDPTASHYIKVMMDTVYGRKQFRNEIIWHYKRWAAGHKHFQRMHDVILRYTNTDDAVFNVQYQPYSSRTIHRRMSVDGRTDLDTARDIERGTKMDDVWDIPYLHSQSKECLGYSTQKPLALLDRILKASSNAGDVVLDPFCGSGTTLEAAHRLQRRYIGIDVNPEAVTIAQDRIPNLLPLTGT